ncbi:MAG: TIGR01212 family radical SAM protein, partial [Anaerovorax sp.]
MQKNPETFPFNSIGEYLKAAFGCKIAKLALDGGFTCPNRDGSIGHGGCIFCSADGSGDFASDIPSQIELLSGKWPNSKYIAYFQSHTNTYAP